MNLYLISQSDNNNYDTYNAAVVAAPDESVARTLKPSDGTVIMDWSEFDLFTWVRSPDQVKVKLIGTATPEQKQGLILASFNAG